jgi:hypothetical protein
MEETKERTWATVRKELQFYIDNTFLPGDDDSSEAMAEASFRPLSAKLLLDLVDKLEQAKSRVPTTIATCYGSVSIYWKYRALEYVKCGAWTEPGAMSDSSELNIDVTSNLGSVVNQMFAFDPSNEVTTKQLVDVLIKCQEDLVNYVPPNQQSSSSK